MKKIIGLLLLAIGMGLSAVPATAQEGEQNTEAAPAPQEVSPDEEGRVQAGILSIQIPQELQDICDIVTEDERNQIKLYERVSHTNSGWGFVGEIQAFESVLDYSIRPKFKRIGEIVLEDGTLYNIVVTGPTDVQFDIHDEQSAENYGILTEAFETVIADSVQAVQGTFIPQDQTDTTSIYNNVLDMLTEEITRRKTREELLNDEFSYLYAYSYEGEIDPLDVIGYSFLDINHDGYAELIIGMTGDPLVYDIFTQTDGVVSHVCSSQERDRWTVSVEEYENSRYMSLRRDASGGALLSEITFYNGGPGMDLWKQTSFIYDAEKDPENPYFVIFLDEPKSISEEEWTERLGRYGTVMTPDYQPLSGR